MENTQVFDKKKIFLIAGAVVAALVVIYLGFSVYFMSHFYFGTKINGVDVSGASVDRAKEIVQQKIDGYELTITERDGATEVITGSQLGLVVHWTGNLDVYVKMQKGFDWPAKIFAPDSHNNVSVIIFNETKLSNVIDGLSCMAQEKQIMPQDASISAYSPESGYTLVPSVPGTAIDKEALLESLVGCIRTLNKDLILANTTAYVAPEVPDDDPELLAAMEQLNTCISTVLTHQVGESTQVLDASIFAEWLSLDNNLQVCIDDEKLTAYVKELASTYNTCYNAKTLMTSYGKTVKITNSHYGWKVDNEAEKAAIIADIMNGGEITRDLNYSMTAASHEGNDYGNSYVEINLTAQRLFLYVDGVCVHQCDFVSGDLSKKYDSPTGAYGITYKQKKAVLNGADYSTPVDYWMPFAGNVGMHDATWRASFGGSIYKRNGSHGCINLPWSSAKTIYSYVEKGFPVLVYKLEGTESTKGKAQDQAYEVIDLIKAIGTVTLEKEEKIVNARTKYDELSATAKKYVTNYSTLTAAESKLAELKAAETPSEPESTEE